MQKSASIQPRTGLRKFVEKYCQKLENIQTNIGELPARSGCEGGCPRDRAAPPAYRRPDGDDLRARDRGGSDPYGRGIYVEINLKIE